MSATGLVRLTVAAPTRRIDLALPERAPLAELLPALLGRTGEETLPAGGWVLRRADGTVLEPARTLAAHQVRDGEVLHLMPARTEWPEMEYDDVVDAIATESARTGGIWQPWHTRTAGLGVGVLTVLLFVLAVLRAGPSARPCRTPTSTLTTQAASDPELARGGAGSANPNAPTPPSRGHRLGRQAMHDRGGALRTKPGPPANGRDEMPVTVSVACSTPPTRQRRTRLPRPAPTQRPARAARASAARQPSGSAGVLAAGCVTGRGDRWCRMMVSGCCLRLLVLSLRCPGWYRMVIG